MFCIRELQEKDFEPVAGLCGQLGYVSSLDQIRRRWSSMAQFGGHAVFVAESSGQVVGWVNVHRHATLGSDPRAELGGLVVDSAFRGQGVGKLLVLAAEKWAIQNGFAFLRFSSQVKRTEAHRFYQNLGYEIHKTSHVFLKSLNASILQTES